MTYFTVVCNEWGSICHCSYFLLKAHMIDHILLKGQGHNCKNKVGVICIQILAMVASFSYYNNRKTY